MSNTTLPVNKETKLLYRGTSTDNYKVIEKEDWIDEGKYSIRSIYFTILPDPQVYELITYRYGSYYSDYEYEYDTYDMKKFEITKVKRATISKEIWVPE